MREGVPVSPNSETHKISEVSLPKDAGTREPSAHSVRHDSVGGKGSAIVRPFEALQLIIQLSYRPARERGQAVPVSPIVKHARAIGFHYTRMPERAQSQRS